MQTYLIIDANNILYRSFFAGLSQKRPNHLSGIGGFIDSIEEMQPANIDSSMAMHKALNYLNKYYKKYNCNDVVMVFDPLVSWRKVYTKNKQVAKTHKVYKAHRRENLTPSEKERLKIFDEHLNEFYALIKEKTGVITLRKHYIECDDFIARFTQNYKDDKHIIISSDKDFIQLLGNGNVTLINPDTDEPRDLAEWDYDSNFFMFEKCIRGDRGDNVLSSYPRIRQPKIVEAYKNDFVKTNIMNHEFTVDNMENGEVKQYTYKTADLFEENQLLMDLTKQPDYIKELIDDGITEALSTRGKYNHAAFLQFCTRNQMDNIIKDVTNYAALLSGRGNLR